MKSQHFYYVLALVTLIFPVTRGDFYLRFSGKQ